MISSFLSDLLEPSGDTLQLSSTGSGWMVTRKICGNCSLTRSSRPAVTSCTRVMGRLPSIEQWHDTRILFSTCRACTSWQSTNSRYSLRRPLMCRSTSWESSFISPGIRSAAGMCVPNGSMWIFTSAEASRRSLVWPATAGSRRISSSSSLARRCASRRLNCSSTSRCSSTKSRPSSCCEALLQARRRGVEQRIHGALAQPRAHPDDQAGHAQSRERVGLVQPREVVSPANPGAANAEDHHRGAPDVSGEMQRVSLERFALVFPRHTLERSRAHDIEQRHHREQAHSQQSRLDVHFVEEQAAKGF